MKQMIQTIEAQAEVRLWEDAHDTLLAYFLRHRGDLMIFRSPDAGDPYFGYRAVN